MSDIPLDNKADPQLETKPSPCKGYTPDYQAMGDCAHCGRIREDHYD